MIGRVCRSWAVVILFVSNSLYIVALERPKAFSPDAIRFFENQVRPVLSNKCSGCHNAKLLTSGFLVESREAILKGGTVVRPFHLVAPSGAGSSMPFDTKVS